ncbi:prepilin-type N-terminal cleavage/methylation domain-containing protein [Anaeromyxobacter dehalogenans]|uniref:Prepilin-type N-terminal cleavage/methylation domain-containing protein n=1 Tax=Anaeromyxobacter dehalogenans (strain 2CP-C) TaxID=290397 RepID=Q2INM8_ANADE|nr:prepilin-type N-terminal cleavage/methylation domain-containing protein [Anaeromyxobacter dehalogenans]ABC80407.1 hypothetical protein Adeh_0631 [Anaeromyxobacter dehalogenans 2CP-C]
MDRRRHGFTLVEAAIVIAVIAALAALAGSSFAAAKRNANAASAAFDLGLRLQALKTQALNEQRELVAVLTNAADGTGEGCGFFSEQNCVRLFVLEPEAGWSLAGFDPASPASQAAVVDTVALPQGQFFDLGQAGVAADAPFDQVKVFDPAVTTDGRLAIRFGANGEVRPVYAGASHPYLGGVALALATSAELGAGHRRRVVVSFPTGILKTATYQGTP